MKKFLSVLLTVCLVFGLFAGTGLTAHAAASWTYALVDVDGATDGDRYFSSGSGTISDPYGINTAQELANLAYLINNQTATYCEGTVCYELTADVDLGGQPWTYIGSHDRSFYGSFNGNGHTVSGLYYSESDSGGNTAMALFGYVHGTVKNLGVSGSVSGVVDEGGIAVRNFGLINHCQSSVTVTATGSSLLSAGGIAAVNDGGTIRNCCNTGTISTPLSSGKAGGIVGYGDAGTIENCYNMGGVSGAYAGGIIGYNEATSDTNPTTATIANCYSKGTVSGPNAGGIAGHNNATNTTIATIKNCYWLGCDGLSAVGFQSEHGTTTDSCSFDSTQVFSPEITVGGTSCATLLEALNAYSPGTWSDSAGLNEGYPMLTDAWSGGIATSYASGSGTAESPYQIATGAQLAYLAQKVNSGETYAGVHFILTNDINLNSEMWTCIGSMGITDEPNYFYGNFNGNGHTVSGLYYSGSSSAALFGYVRGAIENLGVSGLISTNNGNAGGIAIKNFGLIENCRSSVTVTDTYDNMSAGGIAGANDGGTIRNCSNTGAISASSSQGKAGGIVGYTFDSGTIENCYNIGTVGGTNAGGIAGFNGSAINNCYSVGPVSGTNAGGIVGYNDSNGATINNCYWLSTIAANAVGNGSGTITNTVSFAATGALTSAVSYGSTLLTALNGWVAAQTTPSGYPGWITVSGLNSGYPILQAPEATPGAAIDYQAEKLTGLTAEADYSIGGTAYTANANGALSIDSAWFGQTLAIVKKGDGNTTLDSGPQSLDVPTRPEAPTGAAGDASSITGVSTAMEYSADGTNWTACTDTTVTGLSAGTYYVRYQATGTAFASAAATVTVTAPTYTITATPSSLDFGSAQAGYSTAPTAQTVTVKNTGNQAVTLTQPNSTSYDISTLSRNTLAPTETAAFNVSPKTGLSVGSHSETIAISAGSAGAQVSTAFAVTSQPPTVVTASVTDVTISDATLNGSVTADGGAAVTDRGFVYGASANPAISGSGVTQVQKGSGTGGFSAGITSLTANTLYHVRAYAVNSAGTAYGQDVTFTTLSGGTGGGLASTTTSYHASVSGTDSAGKALSKTTLGISVSQSQKTAAVKAGLGQSGIIAAGGTVVVTIPTIPNVTAYIIALPTVSLSNAGKAGGLTLKTDAGSVAFPANMLTGISGATGANAELSIALGDKSALPEAVKAAIGAKPLIKLSLSIDGKQTDWSNNAAPVMVAIPYTPTAEELAHPESIVIWYIDGAGNAVAIPSGHYDAGTRTVTFQTTHFSDYAVAYNKVSFTDVPDTAWYGSAVNYLAARGITGGTTATTFGPDATLTRGQFMTLLLRACGVAAISNPADNFTDAGDTYYTGYLAAAKKLGITSGVGDNKFAPDNAITRQEMFTLVYNALKALDKLPSGTSGKALSDFADSGSIESWASDAMTALVKDGTVSGSGGKLNPTAITTRAELAQVLYNLLRK